MPTLALIAALIVGGGPAPHAPRKVATVADAWRALPQTGNACGDDLEFDYGVEGGMRNFFCRALTVFSWKTFLALAPVPPFRSGAHADGRLDLKNAKQFGHYDPAFVRWAATALIPAAADPRLKAQTQAVYDKQMKTLARVYYQVWRVLQGDPAWTSKERELYRAAAEKGDGSWSGDTVELYHDTLGSSDRDWGGNDPNLVRSATMWWLRRTIDETAPDWAAGLERLLGTYDGAWLSSMKAKRPPKPPQRAAKPEYEQ